jgi:hypothetical protein
MEHVVRRKAPSALQAVAVNTVGIGLSDINSQHLVTILGNCGTSPAHCSGACQHAFGTGCTDADVAGSWQSAAAHGVTDDKAGGQYYYDAQNRLFWTWDTPELMQRKFKDIVRRYKLGGVMAWSLGEDSIDWIHIRTMTDELKKGEYGSGVTATHSGIHSMPMQSAGPIQNQQAPRIQHTSTQNDTPVPQPATQTVSTAHDVASAEEHTAQFESGSGPATPSILQTRPGLPEMSPFPSYGYSTVFVDGTKDGPDGDYSTEPGSPPYYVNYGGDKLEPSAVPVTEQPPVVPQESLTRPCKQRRSLQLQLRQMCKMICRSHRSIWLYLRRWEVANEAEVHLPPFRVQIASLSMCSHRHRLKE